jgi:hypothetical protein
MRTYPFFEATRTKYETRLAKYEEKHAEVKQNQDWFKWYWLALLPKVCGNKHWGATIRQYGLISEHAPIENPKQKYVTSSDKALVMLLMENCGQRFPYLASLPRHKYTQKKRSLLNRPSTSFIRALTPIPRPGQSSGEDGMPRDGNIFWS